MTHCELPSFMHKATTTRLFLFERVKREKGNLQFEADIISSDTDNILLPRRIMI